MNTNINANKYANTYFTRLFLSLLLLVFLFLGPVLFAEISLTGEFEITLTGFPAFPYTGDRFDSSLNPDNYQDIHDFTMDTSFITKLSGVNDTADFTIWLAIKPYNLAQALFAASSCSETAAVADAMAWLGPNINNIDILRANIAWYISDFFILKIGRQSMLTGYGYGWNPIDFANPLKNPFVPEQELKGIDALTARYYMGNLFTVTLSGIYRPPLFESGVDYADIQAGLELTGSFPCIEVKLCGFYDYDRSDGEDTFVPALGTGFMVDIAGVGFYGEGALLWGSRCSFPDSAGTGTLYRKTDWLFSGLIGAEYTFKSEISATMEYFFNGEGYDLDDRKLYKDSVDLVINSDSFPDTNHLLMYRPGYFARHYVLLNVYIPVYDLNTDIYISCMYSPDSWVLNLMPMITYNVSGSLSIDIGYIGLISLKDNQFDEAWFSPVKHIIQLNACYNF